jgi:coniferyl-aldehyde dehydrogenase
MLQTREIQGEVRRPRDSSADLKSELERLRVLTRRHVSPSHSDRIATLERLERLLLDNKDALCRAVSEDFGNRSKHETLIAEIFIVLEAIRYTKRRLREWMAPERRKTGWAFFPARCYIEYQPLGVVGIISPWNYPLQLAFLPTVNAFAAGNRVMLKPSELVPKTAELMAKLCRDAFPDHASVITGGPEVGEAFARLPFDHLVFTGSTRVGKLVMRAASENLVPVTLELGGKSPAIIGEDFPIDEAANRIMLGKLFNSGQTCVAPDYVMVQEKSRDAFVEACKNAVTKMFPRLLDNPDYTSIVSDGHYQRLQGHLQDARAKGAKVVELNPAQETFPASARKMAPAIVVDPREDMAVLQEELFGPILPVTTYRTLEDAIRYVNDHPRPLALYYFGYKQSPIERVVRETVSGGVTINETMLHVAQDDLPFGGVGPSGMGHYHAFEGFETFSKKKAVFVQGRVNGTAMLRPPYGKLIETFMKMVLR